MKSRERGSREWGTGAGIGAREVARLAADRPQARGERGVGVRLLPGAGAGEFDVLLLATATALAGCRTL